MICDILAVNGIPSSFFHRIIKALFDLFDALGEFLRSKEMSFE